MPTHDHGELIHSSIRCVLAQTCDDFEFFIIGDGTPEITKQIIKEYQQKDSRISYFDFPKGPRLGEAYRHEVLQKASGKIVCYVADVQDLVAVFHPASLAFKPLLPRRLPPPRHPQPPPRGTKRSRLVKAATFACPARMPRTGWGGGSRSYLASNPPALPALPQEVFYF